MWDREVDRAESLDKAHGRLEQRWLESTERLRGHTDWPGLKQVCRIRRSRVDRGKESTTTLYAITSLSRQRADARKLLALNRSHWAIENRLHCVRDLALEEDRCRVRAPNAAQALAALRNTALTLARRIGFTNTVEALEHFAEQRADLLHLIRYGIIE